MGEWPFISVIVPVYNDCDGIQQTLRSLFKQNYPQTQYEIIVVDNYSQDDTLSMVVNTVTEFDGNVTIETEKIQSSYAARNKGISIARGEIIAFIDSNMSVDIDWLYKGVVCAADTQADYIGCNIRIVSSNKRVSIWGRYHMALGFPVKDYMAVDGYAPTACLFVNKKVIETVGRFDSRFLSGGDCEFGTRVRDYGFKMIYDPGNVMYHPARNSLSSLLKKQKRVTLGQIFLRRIFPERFSFNRFHDFVTCGIQLFPVASPKVLKKLSESRGDFFSLFLVFYFLRLYTCGLKFLNKCVF